MAVVEAAATANMSSAESASQITYNMLPASSQQVDFTLLATLLVPRANVVSHLWLSDSSQTLPGAGLVESNRHVFRWYTLVMNLDGKAGEESTAVSPPHEHMKAEDGHETVSWHLPGCFDEVRSSTHHNTVTFPLQRG
jgi:hypothetical protein